MIFFRADANDIIGMGHIMRCLSIADAFSGINQKCVFVVSKSTAVDIIKTRGYEVIVLDSDYNENDNELFILLPLLQKYLPHMIIVDSYFVSDEYLIKLKSLLFTVYIDDLALSSYPVNCLVNYNIYGPEIDYRGLYKFSDIVPHFLLGTRYVPLRSEFENVEERKQHKVVKNILISTGGADQIHLALNLLDFISKRNDGIIYHILVGKLNNDFEKILRISSEIDNVIIHYNIKNMKELITSSDIVVSASGSTMYEICRCGVPMIIYSLADNQLLGNESFKNKGIAISCGDLRNCSNSSEKIFDAIQQYIDNFPLRIEVGKKMQKMVNGLGAKNIAEELWRFCLADTHRLLN